MLFGNLIFIKKSGGDGSKYPVTERIIKIGRSDKCLIRIHNSQVALEHCELLIDDNGQAKLKNLSNSTVLNGNPLTQKDVTLCHGDIFKIGERLARWEYLPSSKYYKQYLSPSGRLIAVVMPQQKSLEEESYSSSSRTSAFQGSLTNHSAFEGKSNYTKNLFSAKSGSKSVKKIPETSSARKSPKNVTNIAKILNRRHSLQGPKTVFSPKVKQIKRHSEIMGSKPSKATQKFRKSTKPSWKVNFLLSESDNNLSQSSQPLKNNIVNNESEKLLRSAQKSTPKTPSLQAIVEAPLIEGEKFSKLCRSSSKSPVKFSTVKKPSLEPLSSSVQKKNLKPIRLINSEKKKNSNSKSSVISKSRRRLSLALKSNSKTPTKTALKKMNLSLSKTCTSEKMMRNSKSYSLGAMDSFKETPKRNLVEALIMHTPKNSLVSSAKSVSVKQTPEKLKKTPRKSPKSVQKESVKNNKKLVVALKMSPLKNTINVSSSKTPQSLSSVKSQSAYRRGTLEKNLLHEMKATPRGVRRKLSPSISSAERAAKKLKTSSPKKPDKNKKAALLVLGKANRKQLLSQNAKTLLKQKIVKKALKQSLLPQNRKTKITSNYYNNKKQKNRLVNEKKKSVVKKVLGSPSSKTKALKSKLLLESQKSTVVSPTTESNYLLQEETPKLKKNKNGNLNSSRLPFLMSPNLPKSIAADKVSFSKQNRETICLDTSPERSLSKISLGSLNAMENYSFSSNRRCSKRLSSKNDESRPDFMELSPTALGLMPKHVEEFKTTKESKRRSISVTTPKSCKTKGIIKSASTSKLGNRKSVRFSYKDISINGTTFTPNNTQRTDLDSLVTPNISMDIFVSPLSEKNLNSSFKSELDVKKVLSLTSDNYSKFEINSLNKYANKTPETSKLDRKSLQFPQKQRSLQINLFGVKEIEEIEKISKSPGGSGKSNTLRHSITFKRNKDLQNNSNIEKEMRHFSSTPKPQKFDKNSLAHLNDVLQLHRSEKNNSINDPEFEQVMNTFKKDLPNLNSQKNSKIFGTPKSPKKVLSDLARVKNLKKTPQERKSVKNNLTNLKRVKKLIKTARQQKSPKNDLNNVAGIKRLMKTPREQKSPKNALSDVKGVKRLLKTPREKKSPKNDLTNVAGIKRLMKTPREQKSPKNDLSDVKGVKRLLKTPREKKSPKNDLTNISGIKRLMRTPREQKSPKNDLFDVKGVKKLMKTPKEQKSPKNDLSDLSGVKRLLRTPREQKSPKNDLSDLRGVKKLMKTPQEQKSPKNDLSDLSGVKRLLRTPREQKSPKNDLSDLRGVKKLMKTPQKQKSPKNDLSDLSGVKRLLRTPREQKSPKNDLSDLRGVKKLMKTPREQKGCRNDLSDLRGVRQLLGSPKVQKSPKNDLSDVIGVRKLLTTPRLQKSSLSNLMEISGVENLFSSPKSMKRVENDESGLRGTQSNSLQDLEENSVCISGVKQILVAKIPSNLTKNTKSKMKKSHLRDLRSIRGRRTIYSTPKSPKNDLSDVTGVRELFFRNKPTNDLNISFTGVAELFNCPASEIKSNKKESMKRLLRKKLITEEVRIKESTNYERRKTRGVKRKETEARTILIGEGSLKKSKDTETNKRLTRKNKTDIEAKIKKDSNNMTKAKMEPKKVNVIQNKKSVKELATTQTMPTRAKKLPETVTRKTEKNVKSRKRKLTDRDDEVSPPRLRSKRIVTTEPATKKLKKEISTKEVSSKRGKRMAENVVTKENTKDSKKKVTKPETKAKVSRIIKKTGAKLLPAVQKERSQTSVSTKHSKSDNEITPRETRSGKTKIVKQERKSKSQTKTVSRKFLNKSVEKKKPSPVVKRSTRRK